MEFLSVSNLDKYQSPYKDRKIWWIRWEICAMRDFKMAQLPDHTKWLFVGLVCLAVENGNKIPFDLGWICSQCGCKQKDISKSINILQKAGLIQVGDQRTDIRTEQRTDMRTDVSQKVYPTNDTIRTNDTKTKADCTAEETIDIGGTLVKTQFLNRKKSIYPMLDVEGEIRKCVDWWTTNRSGQIRNWEAAITNWLKKAYDAKGVLRVSPNLGDKPMGGRKLGGVE